MTDKHSVSILWGSTHEPDDEPVTYTFETSAELDAFLFGVQEMDGWMDYEIVE